MKPSWYLYIHVYNTIQVPLDIWGWWLIYMCIYIYVCAYVYIYIYICTSVCIYIYIHVFIYIYVHLYVYIYIYVRVCMYVYIYIYVYIHVCVYICNVYIVDPHKPPFWPCQTSRATVAPLRSPRSPWNASWAASSSDSSHVPRPGSARATRKNWDVGDVRNV